MKIREIKDHIQTYQLDKTDNLLEFLNRNWDKFSEDDLRDIAEYANANRQKNSAFYTDKFIVNDIVSALPKIDKDTISVLEPAVGTGNFLLPFINQFKDSYKKIQITVNDIDPDSLKLTKFFLSKQDIPANIEIEYCNYDFLSDLAFTTEHYDYVIGNPPFQRITVKQAKECGNTITNLAGQFMSKAFNIADVISLVMPKNFLSTKDYAELRTEISNNLAINDIFDFGEKGFKGVLIETIGIILSHQQTSTTKVKSYIDDTRRIVKQNYITDSEFPTWLLYRNKSFDDIAKKMKFDIFNAFRDRQITNKVLNDDSKNIRVIRSRNISKDGKTLINISGYDKYISKDNLDKIKVGDFYDREDVYLVPNMTYYPRMIQKKGKYITNGSVAILTLKKGESKISDDQISFFASNKFRAFYKIARNKGTRSLNIDNTSVFWFGKYNEKK